MTSVTNYKIKKKIKILNLKNNESVSYMRYYTGIAYIIRNYNYYCNPS